MNCIARSGVRNEFDPEHVFIINGIVLNCKVADAVLHLYSICNTNAVDNIQIVKSNVGRSNIKYTG